MSAIDKVMGRGTKSWKAPVNLFSGLEPISGGSKIKMFKCKFCEQIPEAPQMTFATLKGLKAHVGFVHEGEAINVESDRRISKRKRIKRGGNEVLAKARC